MKTMILGLVAFAMLGALIVVGQPAKVAAQELPKGEELPDYPLLDKANKLIPISPDKKTVFAEMAPDGKDKDGKDKTKVVRTALACEVCLREGPLEQFLCKKGTKEHEAIVRVDVDAEFVHGAILAAGGKAGDPTGFVDPKTGQAKYTPATGSKVKVLVHYKKDGKLHTHPAQEWIWDTKKKAPIEHTWVFAGKRVHQRPMQPQRQAVLRRPNSGDIFSISNFSLFDAGIPSPELARTTPNSPTRRKPTAFRRSPRRCGRFSKCRRTGEAKQ